MTESKYEELVSALTKAGVALRDMNGDYRSTFDILQDIASAWDKMSDMEQAALTTAVAGTRMQNVFSSIITQFQEASGAMDAMTESTGTLDKAYNTYLDSVEGRAGQLQATFQALSQTIFNSDMLKNGMSFLTTLTNGLDKLLKFGDGIIAKAALVVVAWNAWILLIPKLIAWIAKFASTTFLATVSQEGFLVALAKTEATGLSGMLLTIPKLIYAIVMYINSARTATAETLTFSAALKAVNLNPVVLAITAAVAALAGLYALGRAHSAEGLGEKLISDAERLADTVSQIEEINSELETTDKRIRELLQKDKLTFVEQEELSKLQQTNSELDRQLTLKKALQEANSAEVRQDFEKTMRAWTTQGNNVMGTATSLTDEDLLRGYFGEYNRYSQLMREATTDADYNSAQNKRTTILSSLNDQITKLHEYKEALDSIDYSVLTDQQKEYYDLIEYYENKFAALDGTEGEILKMMLGSKKWGSVGKEIQEAISGGEDTATIEDKLGIPAYEKLQETFKTSITQGKDFFQEMQKGQGSLDEAKWHDFVNALSEATGLDYGSAAALLRDYIVGLQEAKDETESTEDKLETLKNKFDELKTSLDTARSAFSTVASAIKEFNENGVLSSDTLSKLLALEPEYLNLLVDESGQLNLNTESYEQLIKAKLQNMLLNQMDSTIESIMKMGVEEAAAYAAAEAYDAETDSIYELIAAKMRLALSDAKDKDAANGTDVYTKAIMRMGRTFEPMAVMIDNYSLASENAASSTNKSTSATKANTEALEAQKSALEAQKKSLEDSKKALEDYKNELSDAQSDIRKLTDLVQEYIKAQKDEEKKSLQERKENFDDLIAKEKEELQVKKEAAEFEKTLREKQNTVAKDALAASIASLDNSSAGRKSQKETADALIKSRGDLQETLADHEYDIRIKALDELQKKNDEYYDKQIEQIDEYLSNTRQIYEDACRMIENDTGDLYGKLWEYTYQHTTQTKAEFDNMWSSAQEALQRYGADQYGVIGVMEFLQGEIYNTERDIDALSDEIDSLAVDINNVSGAISALNSEVKNAANDGISNLATQIGNVRDEYEKMMQALQQEANKKWHFSYDGIDYWSTANDFDTAASQIWKEVYRRTKLDINRGYIMGGMHYYANGTNSAPGGLAVVGERGAELEVMNRGNGVLTNKITRGLAALGSNPAQFIADASAKLLNSMRQTNRALVPAVAGVSGNQSVPMNFSYVINGDVNPQTLRELKKYHQQTVKDAVNTMMSKTLGWRNSSRVR